MLACHIHACGDIRFLSCPSIQAVACSLYVVGFGESIAGLFELTNVWIPRGIGAGVVLLLLGKDKPKLVKS